MKQLRFDAESENISVNQKVNNVLMRWLFCYRAIGMSGGTVIPVETWKHVINEMNEESLQESLDSGGHIVAAILAQNDIPLTPENLVEHVFYKTSLYAGNYSHFHHYTDHSGNLCLSFEHSFGLKWSKLLGKSICRFFNSQWNLVTDLTASARNIKIVVHTKGTT